MIDVTRANAISAFIRECLPVTKARRSGLFGVPLSTFLVRCGTPHVRFIPPIHDSPTHVHDP